MLYPFLNLNYSELNPVKSPMILGNRQSFSSLWLVNSAEEGTGI